MNIPRQHLAAAQEAQRHLESGDATGAIRIAEPVLRSLPDYTALHVIMARAYRQIGETDHALARFRSAAELAPKDAARWLEFVDALLKAGQKGRARKVAKKAPLKGSEKKQLLDLARKGLTQGGPALGGADQAELTLLQTMIQQGKFDQARQKAEALLDMHPDSAFLHNILGIVALSAGNNDVADTCFRRTLEISPTFSGAAANLGLALLRQKNFGAAIDVLKKAVVYDPTSVEARTNLANAYLDAKLYSEAYGEAKEVLRLAKDDTDALMLLATSASALGRHDDVLETLDQIEPLAGITEWSLLLRFETLSDAERPNEALALAKQRWDQSPMLITQFARVVAQLGDVDEARALLRKAITANPDDAIAFFHYGMSTRWAEDDPVLPTLKAAIKRTELEMQNAYFAHYAWAKAQADLGQPAGIFASLHRANELQRRGVTFNEKAQDAQRLELEQRWNAEAFERLRGVGVESVAPIFIVGMPRSGSTLLEHVVAAHPEVTSLGEDSFTFPYFPLSLPAEANNVVEAAKSAAKEVRSLSGPKGLLLDKFLYNYQRVGILAAAFPNARFIQTKRDPRAIALSIYANPMKVASHAFSTDLEDIAKFYICYHKLMAHWKTFLGDRIIVSDYETLVEDPEPQIRLLIDRLGLPWDDACLRPEAVQKRVKTLSVVQVRSGIHSGSVERWKRHEKDLQPFTDILIKAGVL